MNSYCSSLSYQWQGHRTWRGSRVWIIRATPWICIKGQTVVFYFPYICTALNCWRKSFPWRIHAQMNHSTLNVFSGVGIGTVDVRGLLGLQSGLWLMAICHLDADIIHNIPFSHLIGVIAPAERGPEWELRDLLLLARLGRGGKLIWSACCFSARTVRRGANRVLVLWEGEPSRPWWERFPILVVVFKSYF